jgi:hypothetical protein
VIDQSIERLGRGLARHVDLGRQSDSNGLRGGRPDSRERTR